ncbi:MAG: choice-of-anchor A family protein, partial [Prevotella sp.]|nr:choice-of-anchor A family protein [Prevotella sp.]
MNKLTKRSLSFITAFMMSIMSMVTGISPTFAADNLGSQKAVDDVTLLVGSSPTDPNGNPYKVKFNSVTDAIKQYDSDFALGIASQFSVFLTGDFIPHNSDAEGRVAVGGNIDAKGYPYDSYNIGKGHYVNNDMSVALEELLLGNKDFAALIWGAESKPPVLSKTVNQKNTQKIAVQTQAGVEYVKKNFDSSRLDEFYEANLLDIRAEMDKLQTKSDKLAKQKNQFDIKFYDLDNPDLAYTYGKDGAKAKIAYVTYNGDAKKPTDTVYFNLDALSDEDYKQFKESSIIRFENIPKLENPRTISQVDKDKGQIAKDVEWEYSYIVVNDSREGDVTFGYRHQTKDGWGINYYTSIKGYDDDTAFNISQIGSGADNPNPNPWIEYNPKSGELDYKLKKHSGTADPTNAENNEAGVTSLLYNFPNANRVIVCCNVQGTILAPKAHITDAKILKANDQLPENWTMYVNESENPHISGAVIANSFEGNIEFGYRPFTGPKSMLGAVSGYALAVSKVEEVLNKETNKMEKKPLAGATLGLVLSDDETGEVVSDIETTNDKYNFVIVPSSIDTFKAEAKEYVKTYTLKEVSAPAGYTGTDETYSIRIVENVKSVTTLEEGIAPKEVEVSVFRDDKLIRHLVYVDAYENSKQVSRTITIDSPIQGITGDGLASLKITFKLEIEDGKVTNVIQDFDGKTTTPADITIDKSGIFKVVWSGIDSFYYYDVENMMVTRIPTDNVPEFVNTAKDITLVKYGKDDKNKDITLAGATLEVYTAEGDELVASGTTLDDGVINLGHLPVGRYYIKETGVPDGYLEPVNDKIFFMVNKNYTISRDEDDKLDIEYTLNYAGDTNPETFKDSIGLENGVISVQGVKTTKETAEYFTQSSEWGLEENWYNAENSTNYNIDCTGKQITKIVVNISEMIYDEGGIQFKNGLVPYDAPIDDKTFK